MSQLINQILQTINNDCYSVNVINHNFQISYANYVQMYMICKCSNIYTKNCGY